MSGPGFSHEFRQRQTQSLVLAPQLRHSLKILQVAALDLRSVIQEELQSNPTIEELPMEGVSLDNKSPEENATDRDSDSNGDTSGDAAVASAPADQFTNSSAWKDSRRSALGLPMLRNNVVVGTVSFSRSEPGGYTDTEIGLLQTFANQAAIAVDNARLLREIEERNTEIGRASCRERV